MGKAAIIGLTLTAVATGLAGHGTGWGQAAQAVGNSGNAAAPQQSSQAAQPSSSAPTLQVYSRETVVDVTVTDAKGQPIHDLKDSDFTVKEDGKPQVLRSFREIRENTLPPARTPPKLPPNIYTNLQPTPTTSAVNILLLDGLNTLPADEVAMRQESIKYLKSMPRGTRVAVLGLTSSLHILQGFTSDPAILIAVVDSKKNRALPSPFIDNDSADIQNPDGTRRCSLEFDVAAYDVFGKRISGLSQTISPRPITAEQYQQTIKAPLRFIQQVDLPAGETFLRVGILDAVSDKVGTLEIPLVVPKNLARPASPPGGTPGGNSGP